MAHNHEVIGSIPISATTFFSLSNEKILRTARVRDTNKLVVVYKHRITGKWIDVNCADDEYHDFELEFDLA